MDSPTPIAVIGIGCRFPGGADSPDKLWELLASGKSTWSPVPANRWNDVAFFDADPDQQGMQNSRGGHFLHQDPAAFDAGFWGLAPTECEAMDPQQRVQLEVAYEALENAGLSLSDVEGSDTAVYVATFSNDYKSMHLQNMNYIPKYHVIGTGTAIVANRISYQLDLRGPSVTLDTGCSGSLVAVHQACQSLRAGECKLALAGGVNLILAPDQMTTMSLMRILSEDGKSYSFDSRGTGYGRGEGAAVVALKRLDDAIRDGDPIRGVIRNSGVNQDGRSNGIMVPKSAAQKDLIESVYRVAGLDPKHTSVVEAHGTGTAVGDPLEVAAIREAFRTNETDSPLYLGSIKPTIGHLESASGIAGLIKGILMLEHGKVPATIGIEELKPNLQLDDFKIKIPDSMMDWPPGVVRRLSLNNFGYGGTNAHAILEAAPGNVQSRLPVEHPIIVTNSVSEPSQLSSVSVATSYDCSSSMNSNVELIRLCKSDRRQIVVLSAKSPVSLNKLCKNIQTWISEQVHPDAAFEDFAYTLASHRSLLNHRIGFVATSLRDVISRLSENEMTSTKISLRPKAIFVFTGQGAQWHAMGRELIHVESRFQRSLQRSDNVLRELGAEWSLLDELSKNEAQSRINESEISQPSTTALQIALVDLLNEIGVCPTSVVGHSSGEIAAAYAAGLLDQNSALQIAYFRGKLTSGTNVRKGSMLAVGLGETDVASYLKAAKSGQAVIACVNSASSSTISGDDEAVGEIEAALKSDGIFARRLKIDRAYHSHHMSDVAEEYLQNLKGLEEKSQINGIRLISSVTGTEKTGNLGPQYWVDNLLSKVRFSDAFRRALTIGATSTGKSHRFILEIGPHNALAGPVRQILTSLSSPLKTSQHGTLLRNQSASGTFMEMAAELFAHGYAVDIDRLNSIFRRESRPKVISTLPSYPWNHEHRYWHESRMSKEHRFRKHPYHDLLGIRDYSNGSPRPVWRHLLSVSRLPWLQEHMIDGEIIFPAAGYICKVIEAMRQMMEDSETLEKVDSYQLREISFVAPLVIPDSNSSVELQLHLTKVEGTLWHDFRIYSFDEHGRSTEHCHGSIMVFLKANVDEVEGTREFSSIQELSRDKLQNIESQDLDNLETVAFYKTLKTRGNTYGRHFACLTELRVNDKYALGNVQIPDIAECMPAASMKPHIINPAIIDAFLHSSVALFDRAQTSKSVVTASIDSFSVSSSFMSVPGKYLKFGTTLKDIWNQTCTVDLDVFEKGGIAEVGPVVRIEGLRLQALGTADERFGSTAERNINYRLDWRPDVEYLHAKDINPALNELDDVSVAQAQKLQKLNQASAFYVDKCLKDIEQLGNADIQGNHKRLWHWMQRFRGSQEWTDLVLTTGEVSIDTILAESRTLGVEGEILARIGESLSTIMTGLVDPLSLIAEQDLLWRLYADDASTRCYSFVISYLRHLTFKDPNLSVLELGAGTGGATEPILDALSLNDQLPFKSYDFTDVSAAFFERSKKRLQRWESSITFRKFDIQQGAVGQGFQEGSYDIIFASNVLHVAYSIDATLSQIQKLLKPGGRVLMIETTKNVPFLNAAIGVLPGWWGATDGRQDGPLLSVSQWNDSLAHAGLGGTELVAKDFEGSAHRSAMIVSRPLVVHPDAWSDDKPIELLSSPTWSIKHPKLINDLMSTLRERNLTVTTSDLVMKEISSDRLYIVLDDGSNPLLATKEADTFDAIKRLVSEPISLLWISIQANSTAAKNPEKGLVTGFARAARVENKDLHLMTLDVQDVITDFESLKVLSDIITKVMRSWQRGQYHLEQDCALRHNQLQIPRVIPDSKINQSVARFLGTLPVELQPFHQVDRPLRLSLEKARFLDRLEFREDDRLQGDLAPTHLEIDVQACGVNFKDMLIAGGHVKKKLEMAGEICGTITKVGAEFRDQYAIGDRVCGFGATPYASRVRMRGDAVGRLPPNYSFIEGASIPVIFATAYHALIDIAKLEKGQSILIHSATGGVGQAAVAIAQWIGAEIFATVGSNVKKQLLIEQFGIPENHIFSSRLTTFKDGIDRLTDGQGVDVVLNSLSGQMLQDSMSCVARFGTFVELGKSDSHTGTMFSMAPFDSGITVASFDLAMMHRHKPAKIGQLLREVTALVIAGSVKMPGVTVLPLQNLGEAFRMMQSRSHVGKLVLDASSTAMIVAPTKQRRTVFTSDATFIIAGGRGGIGFEVAKYLVDNGAKHILLLGRRPVTTAEQSILHSSFPHLQIDVQVLSCDITNYSEVEERLVETLKSMPPVWGVFQSTMIRRDVMLTDMTVEDFHSSIAPKVEGTKNLIKALQGHPLQFCLMLSSIVGGIIGSLAEANYAAGNAYLNALANLKADDKCRYIAVCPGVIEDVGIVAGDEKAQKILGRQGFLSMKVREVIALVNYALSEENVQRRCNEIVSGFDHKSTMQSDHTDAWDNTLFSHLPESKTEHLEGVAEKATDTLETSIANAATREEAEDVVAHAITAKIGTLVAISEDEIDLTRSIADCGLDSLVVVELKNWIGQTFHARLQNIEITAAKSIVTLARLIGSKSSLMVSKVSSHAAPGGHSDVHSAMNRELDSGYTSDVDKEEPEQPKQPLPDLNSSLELWLTAVKPALSEEDHAKARELAEEFRRVGGPGRKLQARLAALASDPTLDNWQIDLYNKDHYLKPREPLLPQLNFYGAHFHLHAHSAAQRAAIISDACSRFRRKLEGGEIDPEFVREQQMSTNQYQWFFNCAREPKEGEDVMMKYPGNDYLVAFRHGHAFKLSLNASIADLESQFQVILDSKCEPESWVGALTTDNRDVWAKNRRLLRDISPENSEWLHTIEAAAFVVSLDDARPQTARERGSQFLYANGFNRWCDKTVQFVICDNGWSGTIGEHSLIDGYAIRRLNAFIQDAIAGHAAGDTQIKAQATNQSLESFAFSTNPEIEEQILSAREGVLARTSVNELGAFEIRAVGAEFFRRHRIPPKSGMQMAIQLASRKYFGFNPIGHETVSLNHFLKGRIECSHTLWPAVKTFCDAVLDSSTSKEYQRGLLLDAIKVHASNLMRATRGHGIDRHLLSLEWSVREGEEMPAFFESELYKASRPRDLMTDCLETGVIEAGSLPPRPGGLWVHYEPEEDKVRFSIWGPTGDMDRFEDIMRDSVEKMKGILEA